MSESILMHIALTEAYGALERPIILSSSTESGRARQTDVKSLVHSKEIHPVRERGSESGASPAQFTSTPQKEGKLFLPVCTNGSESAHKASSTLSTQPVRLSDEGMNLNDSDGNEDSAAAESKAIAVNGVTLGRAQAPITSRQAFELPLAGSVVGKEAV